MITVVYPAWNEEQNMRRTIERSLAALRPQFDAFEILIVDDASTDSTQQIARQLSEEHPEIRVIRNARNLGQGGSLVEGFREARYELLTHNGMDYPLDLADLRLMMPLLAEADIVVAVRKNRPGYTPYRKLVSHANLALLHLLFPDLHLGDYNFVQIYPKSVWQRIHLQATSTGFLMPEALLRARDLGYRISEVEIEYHAREHGPATAGRPRVVLNSIREMLRFWWSRRR